jgi:4a-hydroxytetrahydrobiopterin dehydratase
MERITAQQFSEAEGTDDWRVLWWQAFAVFRTKNFATGLKLVDEIGRLAEEVDHHPDINLRYPVLEVRLATHSTMSLTDKDLDLARKISAAAAQLGVAADPGAIRTWEFALDGLDVDKVRAFWCAVLGYEPYEDADMVDPEGLYPPVFVQQMDEMRTGRNRIHIDVAVPHDIAEERVRAGLAAGGTLVRDNGPSHWTLADPEGNEVDIATWQGRE